MRILLAIDGSTPSEEAVRQLSQRPWPEGSIVRVVSVVPPIYPAIPEATALPDFGTMVQDFEKRAQEHTARVGAALASTALQVETNVRHGDPRLEIVDEAERWGAELVVLGSHGRTGLQRWLIGSVAEYVVRHAPCSVEVARARATPATGSALA